MSNDAANASLLIFFSIVLGSASFMTKGEYGEFLVVGFVILFALVMNYKLRRRIDDKSPGDIMCGWFWLGWITYGYLFRDITVSINSSHILSLLVILLVSISYTKYVRDNAIVIDAILFATLFLLLMPTEDNVFIKMNPTLYTIKIGFFVFLYMFSDADLWMNEDSQYQRSKIVKIIRSTWVLYASRVFLIGVVVQIILMIFFFKKSLFERGMTDEVIDDPSPVEMNDIVVEEMIEELQQNDPKTVSFVSPVIPAPAPIPVTAPKEEKKEDQKPKLTIPAIPSTSPIITLNSSNAIDSDSYSHSHSMPIQSSHKQHRKTKKPKNIQSEKYVEQFLNTLLPNQFPRFPQSNDSDKTH